MKASELIQVLQELIKENGDLECKTYLYPMEINTLPVPQVREIRERLPRERKSNYVDQYSTAKEKECKVVSRVIHF